MDKFIIYSNKKDASDFYGTVSFDPIKDICYWILPILKYFQYFAYSLFYAWAIHLWNKKDMSPCLFFQNHILKFTAFDQFSRNIK